MGSDQTLPGEVLSDQVVEPGQPWCGTVECGAVLRIIDLAGHQGVDFLCYNAHDPVERYNAPNTIKAAENIRLSQGTVLYSDYANPLMTIIADSCGGHDTIGGCCSAPSNKMLYGVSNVTGCRENFLRALKSHGLGWRDIVPNINFFCSVPVHPDGGMARGVFAKSRSKPGDHIDLRAEMSVLAIVSNCPQVHNPCNAGEPTAIRIIVSSAPG